VEVVMVDLCLFLTSALDGWEITLKPGCARIGYLKMEQNKFTIVADAGSVLDGVTSEPHSSKEDALATIRLYTGGMCELYGVLDMSE
jgi:hypothetical protein